MRADPRDPARATRTPAWRAALLLLGGAVAVALAGVIGTGGGGTVAAAGALVGDGGTEQPEPTPLGDGDTYRASPSEVPVLADARAATRPFARVGDLLLHAPSTTPVVVGFHETANPHGLAMEPVGVLTANHNPTRVDPPDDRGWGTAYLIMSSRGRRAPATSAADVVMVDGDPVLAPVTGTVTDVRGYWLYGRDWDLRVEVVPDDAPELRVVLVHVDGVAVVEGDRVVRGETVLAGTARRLGVSSQIDRETEPDRWPHVHLEVQPAGAPRPGDPPPED